MKYPSHLVESIFKEVVEGATTVRKDSGKVVLLGRCPICHEGSSKRKKRFYLLENYNHWTVFCHNCNYETNFESFLREKYPEKAEYLYHQCFGSIVSGEIFSKSQPDTEKYEKIIPNLKIHAYISNYFNSYCWKLTEPLIDKNNEKLRLYAWKKAKDRHIPKKFIDEMLFCYKGKYVWRLIIPFIDNNDMYYNFQSRDIYPKPTQDRLDKKYLFASFDDIQLPDEKIYRQHHITNKRTVYVCEGIIDCMHIENAISLCNCNVTGEKANYIKNNYPDRIWVLDSPYHDNTGYERTCQLLKNDEKCFIMPVPIYNGKKIKDINDLAVAMNKEYIDHKFIHDNTLQGKVGLIKLKSLMLGKANNA